MKTIKRSIALVLAMVLTLAMSITVFADTNADSNTFSLKLNGAIKDHTYEAYQILSGDLSEDKQTLSNVKWGEGIKKDKDGQTELGDAASYAKTLSEMGDNSSELKEQAQIIGKLLESSPSASVTVTDPNTDNVISNLKPGYYLIKDKDDSLKGQESYTEFILHVTDDVNANVKGNVPAVEKKVKDVNDTTGTDEGYNDSADYDIGDDVPFRLTATMADNIESYNTYFLKFNDTLSTGLDYNNDAKITLGDRDVTSYFTINYDEANKTLSFTCNNILAKDGVNAKNGDKIVVEYKAKLNDNAVVGVKGNPNTVSLEFSNNPNNGGEGETGKTPEDKVIVFTYRLTVNKVGPDGKTPLPGAEFTLLKVINGKEEPVKVVRVLGKNAEGTTFTFKGLDDGTYVLRETKTPDGYNTITDQTFTISAKHDLDNVDPKLTDLTGNPETGTIIDLGVVLDKDTNTPTGDLSTDVQNNKGSVLPSTGGAGRVAIYVIGAILVIGGGIVLVTKRRVR